MEVAPSLQALRTPKFDGMKERAEDPIRSSRPGSLPCSYRSSQFRRMLAMISCSSFNVWVFSVSDSGPSAGSPWHLDHEMLECRFNVVVGQLGVADEIRLVNAQLRFQENGSERVSSVLFFLPA